MVVEQNLLVVAVFMALVGALEDFSSWLLSYGF
jgi:hypothetical protein